MKPENKHNLLTYFAPFALAFLFFDALVYSIASFYGIDGNLTSVIYLSGLLLTIFAALFAPKIILSGQKVHAVDDGTKRKLADILAKHPVLQGMNIDIMRIESHGADVCLIAHPTRSILLCTSSALNLLNELDFEAIFAFFSAKIHQKSPYIATVYLLIASLLEKAIIGKSSVPLISSMVTSSMERAEYDQVAIKHTKSPIGYKNMLAKGIAKDGSRSGIEGALGMVSIFGTNDGSDIAKRMSGITSG